MLELDRVYWQKAVENLEAAQSEYVNGRYNSCASRCYYACFQAAIYALVRARIRPAGGSEQWGYDFVQAQFAGQLISRRKQYPSRLRDTLTTIYAVRITADYERVLVTETRALRAVRRSEELIEAVRSEGADVR